MYLSHGGGAFSSPIQRHFSYAHSNFPFPNSSNAHRISMAYHNDPNNASFYSASSVSGEPDLYPFLDQTSAAEGLNEYARTLTNQWGMIEQPGPMVGSPTSLRAAASYGRCRCDLFVDWCLTRVFPESMASATSYESRPGSYGQPQYPEWHWSPVSRWPQYNHPGFPSGDVPSASMESSEMLTATSTPSSGKDPFPFDA